MGAEFAEQAAEQGVDLHTALFSCSGGGLVAGAACGIHSFTPKTEIYSVEPSHYDGMARSLAAKTRTKAPADTPSICDALMVPVPGKLTFPICKRHLTGGLSVSDAEIRNAIRFAYHELKLVIEPGGAAPLAALLAARVAVEGKVVGILLSGANVDGEKFAQYINKAA